MVFICMRDEGIARFDVDEGGALNNVFWIQARARYGSFHVESLHD
jgi:hypothetical protein